MFFVTSVVVWDLLCYPRRLHLPAPHQTKHALPLGRKKIHETRAEGFSFYIFAVAGALCACSQSDTKKLANDAKATGEAVKQTASDALDATKKATDNAADTARKAANSDTAKDLEHKASERPPRRLPIRLRRPPKTQKTR